MMTKDEITIRIAEKDRAKTVASRIAEMITDGCDYDRYAQELTDTYARWLGVAQPIGEWDSTEYELINEVAMEHLSEFLDMSN